MKRVLEISLVVLVLGSVVAYAADAQEGLQDVIDNIGQYEDNGMSGISADGVTAADLAPEADASTDNDTAVEADSIQAYRTKIQYNAQQRAIHAMAEALVMKKALNILAAVHNDAEEKIKNSYSNEKSVLATLAARRGLYNSLLTFKYQIATVRARLRAEALEMDVLPVASDVEIVMAPNIEWATPGRTTGN